MDKFSKQIEKTLEFESYFPSILENYKNFDKIKESTSLSKDQIKFLSKRIQDLPFELYTILSCKIIYNQSPKDIEKVFSFKNSREKYYYTLEKLSQAFGLKDNLIDEKSLKEALEICIEEDINTLQEADFKPSKNFKKKMSKLGLEIEKPIKKILKKVSVFFLIFVTSASIFLGANVEAREKFFDWVIEDFGLYSRFTADNIEDYDIEQIGINDLKINYIPDGFELKKTQKGEINIIYTFSNEKKEYFKIRFKSLAKLTSKGLYDTENTDIEKILINKKNGYIIKKDNSVSILWQQNGIECNVHGNLNEKELIKIAENISKK